MSSIGKSRRDVPSLPPDGSSADLCAKAPPVYLSLWELLLVQSTGDHERQELLSAYHAVEGAVGLPPLARNLSISKTLDIRKFLLNSCIRRAALDDASIAVGPVLVTRMKIALRFTEVYRSKFLRWEFLKCTMMHGVHNNGVLADEQSEGSAVSLPLRCTNEPVADGANVDEVCLSIYHTKMALLFSRDALNLYDVLFRHLTSRGGVITRQVYFAIMLLFIRSTVVHLADEDVHKLIAADFEVDCRDALNLLHRLKSSDPRRRASVRNLIRSFRVTDETPDPDTSEMMDNRAFQRFCASLAFVWLEGSNFSELSLFVGSISRLWLLKTEFFDLDFVHKYSQASYVAPRRSLIPNVDGVCSDRVLDVVLRYEVVKSIFVRFPMYTSAHEDVLQQHTLRVENWLLSTRAGNQIASKRRKKSTMHKEGFAFGLKPEVEAARALDGDDEIRIEALPAQSGKLAATRRKSSVPATQQQTSHNSPVTQQDVFQSDLKVNVTAAAITTPRQTLRGVNQLIGLDVARQARHAANAPTLRQVQYKCYRMAPIVEAPSGPYASRLDASTVSTVRALPSIMQHHHKGKPLIGVRNFHMERLQEAMKAESNASMRNANTSWLLPEIRPPKLNDRNGTRAASSLDTYDLGCNELLATMRQSFTPW